MARSKCLDAGAYFTLTIIKAISIICDNTHATVSLQGNPIGVTINAGPSDTVTLIGLDIDPVVTGNAVAGTVINSGAALHLSKVRIRNIVHSSGDAGGIFFQPHSYAELYITDSHIAGNGGSGSLSGGIGGSALQ